MEFNDIKQIYIDLRQQLYPLMGERMGKVLDSFEKADWLSCFQSCNSIKMLISSEMNETEKGFFEEITSQIREIVSIAYNKDPKRDGKAVEEKEEAFGKLLQFLESYIQLLFKEMSNQGIWFPKSKRHETFQDLLLDEMFGLEPEPFTDKINKLKEKMSAEEILSTIPRQELEKLFVKQELKDVLSK